MKRKRSEEHEAENCAKRRRQNYPKEATRILKQWLINHLDHPYPTEEEKKRLAIETNLDVTQVSQWFVNARRRYLKKMIEERLAQLNQNMQRGRRVKQKNPRRIPAPQEGSAEGWGSWETGYALIKLSQEPVVFNDTSGQLQLNRMTTRKKSKKPTKINEENSTIVYF